MRNLDKILAIVWKDLLTEVRSRELVVGMLVFAMLTIVTFNFAFDLTGIERAPSGAGALWVAFIFASLLGLGRAVAMERDKGSFDGLLLVPVDRGMIYLGKLLGNVIFISAVQLVTIPVFGALFDLPVYQPMLFLILFLGTLGIAGLGTLFSIMAASTRAREVMLPVLLFPLALPVVISTVRATTLVLTDRTEALMQWINLLAAFDVIFLTISFLVFDRVVED